MAAGKQDQEAARAMIQAVYMDGEAEINGRKYRFQKMVHKDRRKVFAFYTRIAEQADRGDLSFLDDPSFAPVEEIINNSVAYNDSLLSRLGDEHWEKYPDDYVTFITTALTVISYPFFQGASTG